MATLSAKHLELIAKAKAAHAARVAAMTANAGQPTSANSAGASASTTPAIHTSAEPALTPLAASLLATNNFAGTSKMIFNTEQLDAIERGLQGQSFVLIGPAGSGKTTTTQELITRMQQSSHVNVISKSTKWLSEGQPGFIVCGYTNKAVNNLRKRLPKHLQSHCQTIHKFIEFAPTYYEVQDEETGATTNTMRFEPQRNSLNPLPHIGVVFVEESSMLDTTLWGQFMAALPNPDRTVFVFLGDLNQIPPIFGDSILGFAMAAKPVVELTQVYRQALLSPIIQLATAVRTNNVGTGFTGKAWHEQDMWELPRNLKDTIVIDRGEHGKVTVHPWKKRIDKDTAITSMKHFLPAFIKDGRYDPEEDQILCPFNESFGTIELNKIIADHISKRDSKTVWEVIARYERSYWAIGDRVLVDKYEGRITKIQKCVTYYGKQPQPESVTLDRWGVDLNSPMPVVTAESVLATIEKFEKGSDDDDAKNRASHEITVMIDDTGEERTLTTAGEINSMLLSYALTIHKSQGSEWRRVFVLLHNSHSTLLSRELLYTAFTRAKEELYIICEGDNGSRPNSILQASGRPVIPGTTLREKVAYFTSKLKAMVSNPLQKTSEESGPTAYHSSADSIEINSDEAPF